MIRGTLLTPRYQSMEWIDLDHRVTRNGTAYEALEAVWNRCRDADRFHEVYTAD